MLYDSPQSPGASKLAPQAHLRNLSKLRGREIKRVFRPLMGSPIHHDSQAISPRNCLGGSLLSMEFEGLPTAEQIRARILQMAFSAQSVHIPSAFSIVEIVRVLHAAILRYPKNEFDHSERDYFVLSKGHGVMALYPILAARRWISERDIESYFEDGSNLPGLYEAGIPGCEANTGSLGQGLGVAAGLALAIKLRDTSQRVYCLVGDGELNEGSTFEALSYIGHSGFQSFTLIVDLNGLQAMGNTKDIVTQAGMALVLEGLGFHVVNVDGHDQAKLESLFMDAKAKRLDKPLAVLAHTLKGKGVSFMEGNNSWHYGRLDASTLALALNELGSEGAK